MMSKIKYPLLMAIVLSLLGVIPLAFSEERYKVRAAPIKHEKVHVKVRTYGVLAPSVEEMSFQIPGRIDRFAVEEGDRVSAGQTLVQLETRDAEDALRKRELELNNARRSLDRMETLFRERSIQESQFEDTKAQFDQVLIAFEQAQLHLARCSLKAPSDGVILKQFIDSRTSVNPGQPVFIFRSDDEQWVTEVDLTDRNAIVMSRGATAEIRFAPYPAETFLGRVSKVAQVANASDGLYTAEVTIAAKGFELRPGMVAEVDLYKETDQLFTIVPFDALLNLRQNKGLVYVVSEDGTTAIAQPVSIESIDENQVALIEDLSDYTLVIVRGQQRLQDHSLIDIDE